MAFSFFFFSKKNTERPPEAKTPYSHVSKVRKYAAGVSIWKHRHHISSTTATTSGSTTAKTY